MNTGDADSSDIPPLFGVSGVFGESASLVAWAHEALRVLERHASKCLTIGRQYRLPAAVQKPVLTGKYTDVRSSMWRGKHSIALNSGFVAALSTKFY